MSEIKVMLIKQSEELSNLRAINTELSKQVEQKDAELKLKCSQFDQLNTEYLKVISFEKHSETSGKKPKTLLIGSSHASNIESTDVSSLFVESHSGATLDELTNKLEKDNSNYDRVIVIGGGNDCSNLTSTTAEITQSMRKLLDKAAQRARKVTVASILPRPKRPDVQLKTDHVNEAVKKLCHENQAYEFVDNDGTFKLSDLTRNDAFFIEDGVHTSYYSTSKLISNLGISDLSRVRKRNQHRHKNPHNEKSSVHHYPERTNMSQQRQHVGCYTCGESGHIARVCRRARKFPVTAVENQATKQTDVSTRTMAMCVPTELTEINRTFIQISIKIV